MSRVTATTRKPSGVVAAMVFAIALTLGLAGCGGDKAASEQDFVGVWEIEAMEGEEGVSSDDLDLLKELGYNVYLTLAEDGEVLFDFVEESETGTWKYLGDGKAEITMGEDSVEATIEGKKLKIVQPDVTMTFFKVSDSTDATDEKATDEAEDATEGEAGDGPEEAAPSGGGIQAVIGQPFGDKYVEITVNEIAENSFGDVGYELTVKNLTDKDIIVTSVEESFTVDGVVLDPFIYGTLDAGASSDEFLYFSEDEVASTDGLIDVRGTFRILNAENFDTLSEFEVSFPAP